MKKSPANDELNTPEEKPQGLLKPYEAIRSPITWVKFLTMTYQSYGSENGIKYKGPILDYCPACFGQGFITNVSGDGEACLICLTGKSKNQNLGIPFYQSKPTCEFITTCPFKERSQKQEKCHQCICKFDRKV